MLDILIQGFLAALSSLSCLPAISLLLPTLIITGQQIIGKDNILLQDRSQLRDRVSELTFETCVTVMKVLSSLFSVFPSNLVRQVRAAFGDS